MSILSSIKTFFFGKLPEAPAVVEQPVAPAVVEANNAPVAPAAPAAAPEQAPAKKPRAPRKPKDDSWLKTEASTKRPTAKKTQTTATKPVAKVPAIKSSKKK